MCQGLLFNSFIKKETLAKVFSCEFCEIFKNILFHRTPLVFASVIFLLKWSKQETIKKKTQDSFCKMEYCKVENMAENFFWDKLLGIGQVINMQGRNSRSLMFFKMGVFKNFCKFHRKPPALDVLEPLFKKLAGPKTSGGRFLLDTSI